MRRRQFIVLLGGAAVWPALGQAQQPTVPTIGFMSGRSPDESKHLVAAFHQGLGEAGFVAGKNVAVNIDGHSANTIGCRLWQPTL
jgi:putative ABC transport system substrate-binding protein